MELDEFLSVSDISFNILDHCRAGPIGLMLQTRIDLGPSQSLGEI